MATYKAVMRPAREYASSVWSPIASSTSINKLQTGFVDRPRRSDCTAGQMDGEAGWWTTSGNIGLPPLARVMEVGRQQQETSSLYNSKHTKHTHATRVQNIPLYSDGTTNSKQHRSKGVQPNGSPCANNHCSTRYEQNFRHNKHIHTLIRKLLQTKIPGTIIKLIANYIKGCKA